MEPCFERTNIMDKKKEKKSIKNIIKKNLWMLSLIKKYAFSLIVYKVYSVPSTIIGTYININYLYWIIDKIQDGGIKKALPFILGICMLCMILNFIHMICDTILVPQKTINLTSKIREDIIRKIRKINQSNFQKHDFFNIYTLGLNEIDSRATQVLETVFVVVISSLNIIVVTGVASGISNGFALFGFVAAIVEVELEVIRQKYAYKQVIETTPDGRKRGYVNRLTYQPEFTSDLKIYNNFCDLLVKNYWEATKRVKEILLKYQKKMLSIAQIQQITGTLFKQLLPWMYLAILLAKEQITIAEATVLATSAIALPQNLTTLLNNISSFSWQTSYIDNLYKIYCYETDIEKDDGEEINEKLPFNISVRNISYAYNKGNEIIHDVSMEIKEGDKVAVVGYNGAGKTTLMKLLIRLYDVDRGNIVVNGKKIRDINTKSLRSNIALLSQDYKIYSLTVAENVLMRSINCEEDVAIVHEALQKVGLYEKILSWKDGINTYITQEFDEKGEYLSGGEAQRLAIARIYAGNYNCIIMDESTSALDPISEDEIISTVFDIFRNKTIIMISHRLVTVKYVDLVYFLAHGTITEQGTHQELMEKRGEYCRFYSSQADKFKICE